MGDLLRQLSGEMAALVEGSAESIVRVNARRRLPATGISWSDNLIVTAHHVVETEDEINIGLPDGERTTARLLGRDPHNDLALLKVDASLTPANWAAQEQLRVGNLVLALGRPLQKIKASLGVTSGLIDPADVKRRRERMKKMFAKGMGGQKAHSGKGRRRKRVVWERDGWGIALADGMIQTDVTMYPGFSGGPLVAGDGVVYGMNTSGFASGVSVAVPVATIRKTVATLLSDGKIKTGYLGIGAQSAQLPESIADSLEQETGLLIVSVEGNSPAAQAGLMVGDILTALDDEPVEHIDELQILLARLAAGSDIKTAFVRGGEMRQGTVSIGAN